LQLANTGSAATLLQQEKNNSADIQQNRVNIIALSAQWQVNPRGDVPSANSSRWPWLRAGADAYFNRRTLPQQEKNNSADKQQNRVNIMAL
jgi:hypothetical protein